MKHKNISQNQKPASISQPAATADLSQNEIDFVPSPDKGLEGPDSVISEPGFIGRA
jgi:hypothetical protein